MDPHLSIQYQVIAQPPAQSVQPGKTNAAPWLYAWSEPVRQKINGQLAVALIASGLFAPVFVQTIEPGASNAAPWIYPWSTPVRFKTSVLAGDQPFFSYGDQKPVVSFSYYNWLSEPVRQKPGLGAWLQDYDSLKTPIIPSGANQIEGWYIWLTEPVRQPVGLRAWLQQFLAYHPRILPPSNVTAVMSAKETNNDVALFGINVYSSITPTINAVLANVSIVEIPAVQGGNLSIEG